MGFRRPPLAEPRVELTAMIDVVFLLLIFFMISTSFIDSPGLVIDLPDATAGQIENQEDEVRIYLSADGRIFLQQDPVTEDQLLKRLKAYGAAAKHMTFLLMADAGVSHGRVISLMDAAQSAGFERLAIGTEKLSGEPDNE